MEPLFTCAYRRRERESRHILIGTIDAHLMTKAIEGQIWSARKEVCLKLLSDSLSPIGSHQRIHSGRFCCHPSHSFSQRINLYSSQTLHLLHPSGEMESLPFEAQAGIWSFLTLNDQAKCRLVCHTLKSSVEYHLGTTTHVRVPNDRTDKNVNSHIYQTYLSRNDFVIATPQSTSRNDDEYPNDLFFSFLGKYCPNLQVLDAHLCSITYDNLLQLPSKLRYFRCYKLKALPGDHVQCAEAAFSQLKSLEGFVANPYEKRAKQFISLAKHLSARRKTVLRLMNPSSRIIESKELESLMSVGLECLDYNVEENERGRLHPIYPNMAQQLIDLSTNFLPTDAFCQSSLPSLRYLNIEQDNHLSSTSYKNVLFTSPALRSFTYQGPMDAKMLVNLLAHFHSLNQLTLFDVNVEVNEEEVREKLTLSLLPRVKQFTLETNCPFELSHCVSESLVHLEVDYLINLQFDFPNLKVLKSNKCEIESLTPVLLSSLSKSVKLRTLCLYFTLKILPSAQYCQSVVDTCKSMKKLQHLTLRVSQNDDVEDATSSDTRPDVVTLDQKDLPNCNHLELKLPCDIVFHPQDLFESIAFQGGLFLKDGENRHYYFDCCGKSGSMSLVIDQNMEKLKMIRVYLLPEPWLVPLLKYFNKIENIDFSVTLPEDEEELKAALALCEPLLMCSNQLTSFHYHGLVELNLLHKLFDYFHTLETLKEIYFCIILRESVKKELVKLPFSLHINRLTIDSESPLELTGEAPESLEWLKIDTCETFSFKCRKLRELYISAKSVSAGAQILQTLPLCPGLKILSLSLNGAVEISAEYLQSLIKVVSRLEPLEAFDLDCTDLDWEKNDGKIEGKVILRQSELPKLRRFLWNVPIDTIFYPDDIFDSFSLKEYTVFSRKKPEDEKVQFKFYICSFPNLTVENVSNLYNLTRLKLRFHLEMSAYSTLIDYMKQLPNIESIDFEPNDQTHQFMVFFDSVTTLRQFTASDLSQDEVIRFLSDLKATGPLNLEFTSGSGEVEVLNDDLHLQLTELKATSFISDFSSPWTCQCGDDTCWLKNQSKEDSDNDFECLNY